MPEREFDARRACICRNTAPLLAAYRARMAAAIATEDGVIAEDDTGFPKQGRLAAIAPRRPNGGLHRKLTG